MRRRSSEGARRVTVAFAACAVLAFGASAHAEVQRVEAVGIYGIRDAMRTKVIPRDEAIADARWEGVSRVALELIGESGAVVEEGRGEDGEALSRPEPLTIEDPADVRLARDGPSEDEAALLREALGKDMLPYTRSYRILEDQGERPVLFADSPGIDTEYVVVMEVIVDVDRVGRALEAAGLVVAEAQGRQQALTVELVGIARYEALEQVLAALRGPLGATRVSTLEFAHERQLLAVEGPFDAEVLATRLAGFEDPRLVLEPVGLDPVFRRIRVLARWFPALEDDGRPDPGPRPAAGR